MWHFFARELRAGNDDALKKRPQLWKLYEQVENTKKKMYGLESHFRKYMLKHIHKASMTKEDMFLCLRFFGIRLHRSQQEYLEQRFGCDIECELNGTFRMARYLVGDKEFTLPTEAEKTILFGPEEDSDEEEPDSGEEDRQQKDTDNPKGNEAVNGGGIDDDIQIIEREVKHEPPEEEIIEIRPENNKNRDNVNHGLEEEREDDEQQQLDPHQDEDVQRREEEEAVDNRDNGDNNGGHASAATRGLEDEEQEQDGNMKMHRQVQAVLRMELEQNLNREDRSEAASSAEDDEERRRLQISQEEEEEEEAENDDEEEEPEEREGSQHDNTTDNMEMPSVREEEEQLQQQQQQPSSSQSDSDAPPPIKKRRSQESIGLAQTKQLYLRSVLQLLDRQINPRMALEPFLYLHSGKYAKYAFHLDWLVNDQDDTRLIRSLSQSSSD